MPGSPISARDRKNFLWSLFLIGLAILIWVMVADATTLTRLQFADLVQQANLIARVHCLRSESHWKNGELWTRTEFAVIGASKGSAPGLLQVEMPGGIMGPFQAHVDEVPRFAPGEEAYLFLWSAPDGGYRVLGWSQGSFRIRKQSDTGLETITQDSAGAPIFDPVSHQFRHGGVRNLPLPAFELKLKRALQQR